MNMRSRISRLEQTTAKAIHQEKTKFPEGYISFPADAPPCVQWCAEAEAAAAVLCPLHGRRFKRARRPWLYRSLYILQRHFQFDWSDHSEQYRKAMKASFPADRWPQIEERRESDGSTTLILRDGVEIPAGAYVERWHS